MHRELRGWNEVRENTRPEVCDELTGAVMAEHEAGTSRWLSRRSNLDKIRC
ncbi:MAG TPA: hypothetical protein VN746_11460 [Gaiella sp.]|nr:hypothetical protein [Gaiella sp.]